MNKKYKYCFKEKKLIEYSLHEENACNVNNTPTGSFCESIVLKGDSGSVLTSDGAIYKDVVEFFFDLPSELCSLNLTHEKYEKAMKLISKFMEHTQNICNKLVQKNCKAADEACKYINSGCEYVSNEIEKLNTMPKLKNIIKKHPVFVGPNELAIGLKWKGAAIDPETQIPNHEMTEATFHYVPILKTLASVFGDQQFIAKYIKYNLHEKHQCIDGIYQDFCCGSLCQSNEFLKDPLTIKLQLGTDDFEVCCPVKSKATIHKVNATYVQIKNMPIDYRSKLENIYLVSLCNTANFKCRNYDYNHLAGVMVDEIQFLEMNGIDIGEKNFKGTIFNIACDNLGANSVFGFVECFRAKYFCRHCEATSSECKTMVKANETKRRTKSKYEALVKYAEDKGNKSDFSVTMGIKKRCEFNKLKHFHVMNNMSMDVMHDINEGVIVQCLHGFFECTIRDKILTEDKIQQKVRDFNYYPTQKKKKPSLINLAKINLNQNASQLYCLMTNLPFIFVNERVETEPYWQPVETLLSCMQIIYSPIITEKDLDLLDKRIQEHLTGVLNVYNRQLTPKQHFLVHYPEFIRKMGPSIHLWTMRLEAKHKTLTEMSRRKMNFKNLTKLLSFGHQEQFCKRPSISIEPKPAKRFTKFNKYNQFGQFETIVRRDLGSEFNTYHVHDFATYDTIVYRKGNLIIENGRIYEIALILSVNNSLISFIVDLYAVKSYDKYFNSLVIEKQNNSTITLDFNKLQNKRIYDKMYANEKYFIRADNLILADLA